MQTCKLLPNFFQKYPKSHNKLTKPLPNKKVGNLQVLEKFTRASRALSTKAKLFSFDLRDNAQLAAPANSANATEQHVWCLAPLIRVNFSKTCSIGGCNCKLNLAVKSGNSSHQSLLTFLGSLNDPYFCLQIWICFVFLINLMGNTCRYVSSRGPRDIPKNVNFPLFLAQNKAQILLK